MNKKWRRRISLIHKQLVFVLYYSTEIKWVSKSQDKKKIIICFDGLFPHGGLVDRLKGIISFYEVAKKLDYDFYIYFEHPFSLLNFLQPNKVNWKIDKIKLKYNIFNTKILYLMNDFEVNPFELIQKSNSKTILIYSNVDYIGAMNTNNSLEENNQIWRTNYNELFKNSPFLDEALMVYQSKKRIVFHTRFTSLMGDFKDTTSLILDDVAKQNLINKLIIKINETVVLHSNATIYVLSDSVYFLNYIKENTTYSVLDGIPIHLDTKNNSFNLSDHLKTFIDFYFIAKSDAVYMLKIDEMYSSGFSKYAAILGNTKWKVIQN